jgi:hypothetical protein
MATPSVADVPQGDPRLLDIDTQDPPNPPSSLLVRGEVTVTAHDHVFDERAAAAAQRYQIRLPAAIA